MFPRVIGDALPEQAEHNEISVLLMNTGSTQFDQFGTNRLKGGKIKLLLAVIATIECRSRAGLQTICADNIAGRDMLDEQVVTCLIERIGIESRCQRFGQSLIEFEIKDREA